MLPNLILLLLKVKECSRFSCMNINVAHIWKVPESHHVTYGNKHDSHVVVMLNTWPIYLPNFDLLPKCKKLSLLVTGSSTKHRTETLNVKCMASISTVKAKPN